MYTGVGTIAKPHAAQGKGQPAYLKDECAVRDSCIAQPAEWVSSRQHVMAITHLQVPCLIQIMLLQTPKEVLIQPLELFRRSAVFCLDSNLHC